MGWPTDLRVRSGTGALALAALVLCGPALTASARGCGITAPGDWPWQDLRWSGRCRDGLADGRGVLRAYDRGHVVRLFYGRLKAGRLDVGAVEMAGGYVAGRFDNQGHVIRDGDRNTLIQAFDEASAAAHEMAERFRALGNGASARFYDERARGLAQQVD